MSCSDTVKLPGNCPSTAVKKLPPKIDFMLVNKSDIEDFVFEDCRHAYIFQTSDGYRYFRLVWFILELVYIVFASFLVYKYRGEERMTIRSIYSFVFYTIGYLCSAFAASLTEFYSNEVSFLNQCEINEGLTGFGASVFVLTLVVRVILYYNGYELYKHALGVAKESRRQRFSSFGESEPSRRKDVHQSKTTSLRSARNLFAIAFILSLIGGLLSVAVNCPQDFLPPVSCSQAEDNDVKLFLKYLFLGGVMITFLLVTIVRTKGFPDPFLVLYEAKATVSAYGILYLIFVVWTSLTPPGKFTNLVVTPTMVISLFTFTGFTIVVVYPCYLCSKEKHVTISLKQMLSDQEGRKLIEMHLAYEHNLEVLRCYEAIQKFKQMFEESSHESLLAVTRNIYRRYIDHDTAQYPINLGHVMATDIRNNVEEGNVTIGMFDRIAHTLLSQLEFDIYPRFQRCPFYALFIGLSTVQTLQMVQEC